MPGVRLNLPEGCTLMQLARSLGAHDLGRYGWQVRVTDFDALLSALRPVLQRRLESSPLAGATTSVVIDLYRERVELQLAAGRLKSVGRAPSAARASIRLRSPQLTQLLLGYRSREELEAQQPDVRSAPADRMLLDVLFPRVDAFLYAPY
jgi:hypothetical protein